MKTSECNETTMARGLSRPIELQVDLSLRFAYGDSSLHDDAIRDLNESANSGRISSLSMTNITHGKTLMGVLLNASATDPIGVRDMLRFVERIAPGNASSQTLEDRAAFCVNQPKVFEAIWLGAHGHGSTPAGWNIVAGTNAASAIDTQLRAELVRRGLPPAPPLRHKNGSPIAVHEYPMCGLESLETTLNHLLQLATSKMK